MRGDDVANICSDQQTIFYHKNCVSSYISKTNLSRIHLRNEKTFNAVKKNPPKVRRSISKSFDFKTNCLFCGDICDEKVSKYPERWKRVNIIFFTLQIWGANIQFCPWVSM